MGLFFKYILQCWTLQTGSLEVQKSIDKFTARSLFVVSFGLMFALENTLEETNSILQYSILMSVATILAVFAFQSSPCAKDKSFDRIGLMINLYFAAAIMPWLPAFLALIDANYIFVASITVLEFLSIIYIGSRYLEKSNGPESNSTSIKPSISENKKQKDLLMANRDQILNSHITIGPIIGTFAGESIPEWFIDARGGKHVFKSVIRNFQSLKLAEYESLVSPGLLYIEERPKVDS